MNCLHNKEAGIAITENGSTFSCNLSPSCQFSYPKKDAHLYKRGINAFLATKQEQPFCCDKNLAKLKIIMGPKKSNYGRPFFKCSKEIKPCNYFEWCDVPIVSKPQCCHGKTCKLLTVKEMGSDQGRTFFKCPEGKENQCRFFKWNEGEQETVILRKLEGQLEGSKFYRRQGIRYYGKPPSFAYSIVT